MVVSLIPLIISLLALGFCLDAQLKERKASRELDAIIADLKKEKERSHPAEVSASLEKVSAVFDSNSKTLFLDGNIEASGYISAGGIIAK